MESDDAKHESRSVDAVVDGDGSAKLAAGDVATTALDVAERLSADLVEGRDAFESAVAAREQQLADRVAANAALGLMTRAGTDGVGEQSVTDLDTLRRLVERIATADALVDASREAVQDRSMTTSDLAVHPSSIRDAADDVRTARAELEARRAELSAAEVAAEAGGVDGPEAEMRAPIEPDPAAHGDEPRRFRGWQLTDREALRTPALVVAVALVIGVLALVVTGSPLALALPGLAVCWVVVLIVRQRDDAYDAELASRNLLNVTRLADQAYGGVDAVEAMAHRRDDSGERAEEAAVRDAENRLAFAEASWRSLVGPDADVDDLESVLMKHDARFRLGDHAVDEMPSVRTAAAHRRRLLAQWKLAWWALDRPVPRVDEADDALRALEAAGIATISVPTRSSGGLSEEEQQRLEELAAGRSEDELRAASEVSIAPMVVADEDGEIDDELFRAATAQLPSDVRVVVVAPDG